MTLSPCTIEYLQQAKQFLLTNPNFKYDSLVSEYDQEKDCGTCCCLLGWSPAFSQHFKWEEGFIPYIVGHDNICRTIHYIVGHDDICITIQNELEELFLRHHIKLDIEMKQVTAQHMIEEIERLLQ